MKGRLWERSQPTITPHCVAPHEYCTILGGCDSSRNPALYSWNLVRGCVKSFPTCASTTKDTMLLLSSEICRFISLFIHGAWCACIYTKVANFSGGCPIVLVHPSPGFAQRHRIELEQVFYRSGRGSGGIVRENSVEIDWAAVRYPRSHENPSPFSIPEQFQEWTDSTTHYLQYFKQWKIDKVPTFEP